MAQPKGPNSRRVHLGAVLMKMRDDRGLTRNEVAAALNIDPTKLWRVERGRTGLQNQKDLRALLDHYGVTDPDVVDNLLQIHRESLQDGWWTPYNPHLAKGMREYVGMETDATAINAWQPNVVFGLLQTEAYARALLMSAKLVDETTSDNIDANVQLRMERKTLVTEGAPRHLWVIMSEAALRGTIGSYELMEEQRAEIVRLSEIDHISVQILPDDSTGYRASQNFVLLEMGPPLGTIVQADQADGQASITDAKSVVGKFLRRFDGLRAAALGPNETPRFIRELNEDLKSKRKNT
ncbi:helix-turn-helix domain-containing protein [Streptomyces brevispora]|uniref:helix-turn-helix domain-containing protein n=1 Tax=Streptomyces brevispora TaxID=887462 RepID=UPI0037F28905